MDDERTTRDDAPEDVVRLLGELRIPTARGATKQFVQRIQREQSESVARSREITESLTEAARKKNEREAEMRDAIIQTRDELRRLNAKTDDLAGRQTRTDRMQLFLGAATALLALAALVDALSG